MTASQRLQNKNMSLSREFQHAVYLYETGKRVEAESLCQATLKTEPNRFDMLYLLGILYYRQGKPVEALHYLFAALKIQPANVMALSSLGLVQSYLGQVSEALASYDQALALKPDHAEALNNQGNVLMSIGRAEAALANYDKVLALEPHNSCVLNNRGNVLRELKRPDEALASFNKALTVSPGYVEAYNGRGNALRDLRRPQDALASYERALALKPDHVEVLNNRGNVLVDLGFFDDALASYEKAVALKSEFPEAFNNRGNALRGLKRPEDALTSFDKALALKPDYAGAFNNRGNALMDLERFAEALESYEKALILCPDYVEALNNRGNALLELGRLEESLMSCEKALALGPDFAEALNSRGNVLVELQRTGEALASYDKASIADPTYAEAYNNKGLILSELGELMAASQAIETAISLAPKPRFYYNLSECKRFLPGDRHVQAMEDLMQDVHLLSLADRIHLHFGLGKALADFAEHERAFRHLLMGNALKRSQITYNEAATLDIFARRQALFTGKLIEDKKGLGSTSEVPIFILGMPRSGSSLIEQILASHPKVFGAGESGDFVKAIVDVSRGTGGSYSFEERLHSLDAEFRELGTNYVDRVRPTAPGAGRIVDKTPENFRLIGLIHLALPNARIIHTRRDPVDTCLSCFSKLFIGNNLPYTYDLAELGRYYRAYESMMHHWHNVLPQNAILDVPYEDVVADLEGQVRRILDYCGLDWDPRCLDFHRTNRPVRTASKVQVRQPIYRSSVGRWHTHESFLEPLLAALAR